MMLYFFVRFAVVSQVVVVGEDGCSQTGTLLKSWGCYFAMG